MTIRIAGAASFPRDRPAAAGALAQSLELDYLIFSYLSSGVSRNLLLTRIESASAGFVTQFVNAVRCAAPALYLQPHLRLLTNAGGFNTIACAAGVAEALSDCGCGDVAIAVVRGDDLFDRLEELRQAGCLLDNVENGQSFAELTWPIVGAHAHTGAAGHVAALDNAARVIIGGSTVAEALTLAAAMHELGWTPKDIDQLAGAAAVGQILAAGTFGTWDHNDHPPTTPGYPIAEFEPHSSPRITKNLRSEGTITEATVRGILLRSTYTESPKILTTPDIMIDVQHARYVTQGAHAIQLEGITGHAPSDQLDVTIWYQRGYQTGGLLRLELGDVDEQIELVHRLLSERMERAGRPCGGASYAKIGDRVVKWQFLDDHRETVEAFADEIARLPYEGPRGILYLSDEWRNARPAIRSWPTKVSKELLETAVDCRSAADWL